MTRKNLLFGILLLIVSFGSLGALAWQDHGATVSTTRELAQGVWTVAVEMLGFEMAGQTMDVAPASAAPQASPKVSPPAHKHFREFARQAHGSAVDGQVEAPEFHPAVE
jgi:hypothetical protein